MRTGKFSGNALKTRSAGPLALSASGGLAASIDRHSLFVWRTGVDIYQPLNLHHTKPYTCLAISADDSLIAAGDVTGRLLIWRAVESRVPSALRDKSGGGGAAGAGGEGGAAAAAGGQQHVGGGGKVRLPAAEQPPLTTLHWHAHPMGCLAFSSDGTHLLSGGAEGVLVIWNLETQRPNFLPRLGGPLVGLHPSPADPAKYVVRQADNVVRIINIATMKVEASVMGLRPPPVGLLPPAGVAGGAAALLAAPGGGEGTAVAPAVGGVYGRGGSGGLGVLVVACENAQLQFYDVERDRHLHLVQAAPRNAMPLTAPQQQSLTSGSGGSAAAAGGAAGAGAPEPVAPPPPFVSLVAFSGDGSVMATVDVRSDAGPYGSTEACLKFWDAATSSSGSNADRTTTDPSTSGSGFALNTRVDEPHADQVTSLVYHPSRHMVVTTGGSGFGTTIGTGLASGTGVDSEFKVWIQERRSASLEAKSGDRSAGTTTHWRCQSTGGYKGLPLGAAAFSPDGSILAVAAAARVTLWDAESTSLAAVLPAATALGPAAAPPLTQLVFVPGTPYLAAASPSCVAVYNLLTAAVHWCFPYGAVSICADAAYGLLAVALPAPSAPPQAAAAATDAAADASRSQKPLQQKQILPKHPKQQQQGQEQQQRPQPSCHVVVIDPRDGSPKYHCHLPDTHHVHLAHVRTAAATASTAGDGCSPLLILRDNRQFSVAALPGSLDASRSAAGAAPSQVLLDQQPLSAFEAAFGREQLPTTAAGAAPMEVDGGAAAVGGKPLWAALFDAPSHVLPPPTALANAFLSLLTTSDS
ncbi:hypothetical protein Agub_g2190 [Astrephomene gubernaculifera]|uniref:WD repeat-containing protein 75 second beta-propeller domain-containing protein n=1 Tax=Astrephomene gubernaculifera TaxID=47775 RepID=A0AAD3DGS0_9CHLO|nr:hypothetical protein Agub_g2190 [Astrephomene gubernaculifera]